MKKRVLFLLAAGAVLTAAFSLSGCFSSPTNPHENAFTGINSSNGGDYHNTAPTAVPTIPAVVATPTPSATGQGTISGTVTGTLGNFIEITAVGPGGSPMISTTRTGDGPYTISNIPTGSYGVVADTLGAPYLSGSYSGPNPMPPLAISGNTSYTNINITMH